MTVTKTEQQEAIVELHKSLSPGDTLHTVLRHVSASGMTRWIDVYRIVDGDLQYLTYWIAKAAGYPVNQKREGLKVGGCGMDMGFDVVYNLSRTLYPDGFDCIGEGCPSNDHSNYRDSDPELPKHHSDGGYAITQRWI